MGTDVVRKTPGFLRPREATQEAETLGGGSDGNEAGASRAVCLLFWCIGQEHC